jgi:hypothetical protein
MKTTKRKPTKTSNLLDSIIPFSATAKMVVEEGDVSAVIDGYLFNFTVQEYSSGTRVVLLDSDTPKARRILKKFDASFKKKTDEIFGDEFVKRIYEIYGYSNSRGGMACNWITDEKIEYKELN